MLESLLSELWRDLDEVAESVCKKLDRNAEISKEIEALRKTYRDNIEAPNFEKAKTRMAYSVAYHPAHVFAYFHLLSQPRFGDVVRREIGQSPTFIVLGAGLGAETIAMIRWLSNHNSGVLRNSRFILVDRADWTRGRDLVFRPLVSDLIKEKDIHIDHCTWDFATPHGLDKLRDHAKDADVIMVPSLLTELITEHCERPFLDALREAMSDRAILVLVDHHLPEYQHVARQFAHNFKVLTQGTGAFEIPSPSQWIRNHLLTGETNRIPVGTYPLSWSVLRKPLTSGIEHWQRPAT